MTIGDVLLTARRALDLTHTDLVDRVGVTQAALSRYENDMRTPDPATLDRLADALGLSRSFLTHSFRLSGAIAADAHMRRQRSTKVSDWKRVEARLNLLRMRSAYLFERVPMNTHAHVPTFDPDETSPADAARLVRAQWRMPIGGVRHLMRWLEAAGVLVVLEPFGTRRIDGLSQWAADHPVILVNAELPADRLRWTLAHELGHLVLHTRYVDDDVEQQANLFAAEFLMPAHTITPALQQQVTAGRLMDLKLEYGVSMQAVIEHAHRLGRMTADERRRLYRTFSARGWRTNEPGSDRIATETPALVHLPAAELRKGGLSDSEIALLTGASSPETAGPFLAPSPSLRAL